MTTYGLTDQGFVPEPLAQINTDILAAFRASFGSDIDATANGPFGIFAGLWADREAPIWQVMQAVYNAAYPDTASGAQLDDVASLTGVVRLPPTKSAASVVLIGTNGTVVPAGTTFATATSGVQFVTTAGAVIAVVSTYVAFVSYAVGAIVSNGGNIYSCIDAITTGTTGPTGTTTSADGDGIWLYIGAGSGAVAVPCFGTSTGPLSAPSGTLTVIATPVAGLNLVKNPLDAVLGTNIETDAALRLRRIQLLQLQGSSPVTSIRAALLNTAGVTSAAVYENATDVVDGNGRPPHSVECVVVGGTNLDVATTIFNAKAAGINTTGLTGQNVTDPATGRVYSILFTRSTSVPIYVVINLKKGATWPTNGVALAQAAVIAYAAGQVLEVSPTAFISGQTVYAGPIAAAEFDQFLPGQITDITSVFIGTAPGPGTNTPITLLYSQIAAFDTSRVTVNAT